MTANEMVIEKAIMEADATELSVELRIARMINQQQQDRKNQFGVVIEAKNGMQVWARGHGVYGRFEPKENEPVSEDNVWLQSISSYPFRASYPFTKEQAEKVRDYFMSCSYLNNYGIKYDIKIVRRP